MCPDKEMAAKPASKCIFSCSAFCLSSNYILMGYANTLSKLASHIFLSLRRPWPPFLWLYLSLQLFYLGLEPGEVGDVLFGVDFMLEFRNCFISLRLQLQFYSQITELFSILN
jgi:hypothetical protein